VSQDASIVPEQLAMQNMDLSLLRSAFAGEPIHWSGKLTGSIQLENGPTGAVFIKSIELGDVVLAAAVSCVGQGAIHQEGTDSTVSVHGGRAAVEREALLPRASFATQRDSLESEWKSLAESWLLARGVVNCFM
jgi:hypothetical protein